MTYKQLGNGVSVGAVWHVVKQAVEQYEEILRNSCPSLVEEVFGAPMNPDEIITGNVGTRGKYTAPIL
jgi:DNA (cytosine-5)-methyltransferase 1